MGTVTIPARDGVALGGTVFEASIPRGVLLVSGATAVPHRFYHPFAEHMAGLGWTTVTYDYRGIGESLAGPLRKSRATMTDWALRDLPGAADWTLATFGVDQIAMIGHSVGGQVAGLYDRPGSISKMVTMSAQSGHWRYQGGGQRAYVAFNVWIAMPIITRIVGYVPWSRFARGEDLPSGVGLEWASWSRHRRYLFRDERLPLERYTSFTAPTLAYSFADDDWGTERSVRVFMSEYPTVEYRHIAPSDIGMNRMGHMGAFGPEAKPLWNQVADWLR